MFNSKILQIIFISILKKFNFVLIKLWIISPFLLEIYFYKLHICFKYFASKNLHAHRLQFNSFARKTYGMNQNLTFLCYKIEIYKKITKIYVNRYCALNISIAKIILINKASRRNVLPFLQLIPQRFIDDVLSRFKTFRNRKTLQSETVASWSESPSQSRQQARRHEKSSVYCYSVGNYRSCRGASPPTRGVRRTDGPEGTAALISRPAPFLLFLRPRN